VAARLADPVAKCWLLVGLMPVVSVESIPGPTALTTALSLEWFAGDAFFFSSFAP